jgi:hypothetical protein
VPCDVTTAQHFVRRALFPHLPPIFRTKIAPFIPIRPVIVHAMPAIGRRPIQMFPLSAFLFLPLPPTKYHLLIAFTMIVHLSQQLFDAIDILTDKWLLNKWIGSIVLNCIPVMKSMVGKP